MITHTHTHTHWKDGSIDSMGSMDDSDLKHQKNITITTTIAKQPENQIKFNQSKNTIFFPVMIMDIIIIIIINDKYLLMDGWMDGSIDDSSIYRKTQTLDDNNVY